MIANWKLVPLALLLYLLPREALAKPIPDTAKEAAARRVVAKMAFERGNFAECAEQFQASYDLAPDAKLLFNVGLCEEKGGNLHAARDAYAAYVQAAPEGEKAAEAKTRIDLLGYKIKELAEKEERAPQEPKTEIPATDTASTDATAADELEWAAQEEPFSPPSAYPPQTAPPPATVQSAAPEKTRTRAVGFGFFGYGLGSGKHTNIHGLSINALPGYVRSVRGLQIGSFHIVRKEVVGVQLGYVYSHAGKLRGFQFAAANYAGEMRGFQAGAFNFAKKVTGVQLGALNYTEVLHGVQIGILNIATKNWLPAMVGLNAGF